MLQERIAAAQARLRSISDKLTEFENRLHKFDFLPQISEQETRVRKAAKALGLKSARFARVPPDYYEHTIEWRRSILAAPSIHHLCKSIVLENKHCRQKDGSDPKNAPYYCAILQYTTKLGAMKLFHFVRGLTRGPKKGYKFHLAPAELNEKLTGFEHNSVSPLGLKTPIPILLSESITKLQPGFIWLGGGEVDLKLGIQVSEFLEKVPKHTPVFVGDITLPRANPDAVGDADDLEEESAPEDEDGNGN